ncbi:hypothetical protein HRI_002700900 [Hibiscus trionum]|uniref:Nuclease HARBI1 n=1 Tax=Hibiscus trionum TaxID=183268 RepID=A0A9W7I7J8_HIBTR|nr:hypothetical protein HRI_002700900 [Hibiscus trionum]
MPSYSFEKQRMIVVCAMAIHNFIRKHAGLHDADFMEFERNDRTYKNIIDPEDVDDEDSDDNDELNTSSGYEMELVRDGIACSLMNSL